MPKTVSAGPSRKIYCPKSKSQIEDMKLNKDSADCLTAIPGVGKSIAGDLRNIGILSVNDLNGKNPEALYELSNKYAGVVQDKCLLYVFRCAVYFADGGRSPEKLKWWNWKG
jgi:hypothetical protein